MLLFENSALGTRFTLARPAIDIVGIAVIAMAIEMILPKVEVEGIYRNAEKIG